MLSRGDRAPDFTLPSGTGGSVHLYALLEKGPVVLFFYPKDDTPGCTTEACSFRDHYNAFVEAGAQVVGVSADSVHSHEQFASKHHLPMTLLSDGQDKVRALYGVRRSLGLFPGRVTFVIDRTGVIQYVFSSQLRFDAHQRESLRVVQSLARSV